MPLFKRENVSWVVLVIEGRYHAERGSGFCPKRVAYCYMTNNVLVCIYSIDPFFGAQQELIIYVNITYIKT